MMIESRCIGILISISHLSLPRATQTRGRGEGRASECEWEQNSALEKWQPQGTLSVRIREFLQQGIWYSYNKILQQSGIITTRYCDKYLFVRVLVLLHNHLFSHLDIFILLKQCQNIRLLLPWLWNPNQRQTWEVKVYVTHEPFW